MRVTGGTTFESGGSLGLAGLTQASFGTTLTSTNPHLVSVVVGLGWHPAEQCSAVEASKSRGPVGDLIGMMDRLRRDHGMRVAHSVLG